MKNKVCIGDFDWLNGSVNDNIRALLKKRNTGYYNTFNGDIYTNDGHKITAVHQENNKFNVYIEV